jgi:hypothetical protein
MNTIRMNLGSYSIENEALQAEEYGDEVMYAGWNPQVAVASQQPHLLNDRHVDLLAGLVNLDVDTFLQKMYEFQR